MGRNTRARDLSRCLYIFYFKPFFFFASIFLFFIFRYLIFSLVFFGRHHHRADSVDDKPGLENGPAQSPIRHGPRLVSTDELRLLHRDVARIRWRSLLHQGNWESSFWLSVRTRSAWLSPFYRQYIFKHFFLFFSSSASRRSSILWISVILI